MNYKCKLYEVIRNNGGWENWKMEIINFFNCKNHYEARKKEQEYFLSLNASLNSIEPYAIPKPKEIVLKNTIIKDVFHCKECNKYFNNKDLLEIHKNTKNHKRQMETKNTSNTSIVAEKFNCLKCDFKCCKKGDWTRHLSTTKHKKSNNVTTSDEELHKKTSDYICMNCSKNYISRNGLWLHKQKCKNIEAVKPQLPEASISGASISGASISGASISGASISGASISGASISGASISGASISDASSNIIQLLIKESSDFKNILLEMVKSNTEIQKQMLDVCKSSNSITNTNSHNNTTTNNKIFNLQVFLNEECKDAMNMSDFINSIEVKSSDLENIGKNGYIEGMSTIIIKKLNDTDMNKRPIHCSDAKRETLYIKEENKWEKDTQETKQMFKAVRGVDKKNCALLANWKATHPKCMDSKSHQSDDYMKIVSKVMDGEAENVTKVIKKVAKEVVIEKEK
jgi:hypothetical protein